MSAQRQHEPEPSQAGGATRRWLPASAWRRGALFIALGVLLHVVEGFVWTEPDVLHVVIDAGDVTALERAFTERTGWAPDDTVRARLVAQEVDDRLLVAEARRRGWHRTDPVIQRRLVQNQRFLGASESATDAELLARAYEQGMDETDVVVKRRLLERVRLAVAEASRRDEIPREDLAHYLEAHPEEFRRPARVALVQIYLSRDRRGDALESDAQALAARLEDEAPDAEAPLTWADPSLLPQRVGGASRDELARRFGADFAAGAFDAPLDTWTGPVASSFGLHFVRITGRSPAADPPLDEIEPKVRARVQRDREAEALDRLIAQLRSEANIVTPIQSAQRELGEAEGGAG